MVKEIFNIDQLHDLWTSFVIKDLKFRNFDLYCLLSRILPELRGSKIVITIGNNFDKKCLLNNLKSLTQYLREELNNDTITIGYIMFR